MKGRAFTLADQTALEPGWYWILRSEPDGPPEWEIGHFIRSHGAERWELTGTHYPKMPTTNPDASNAWRIGDRVELPA